MATASDKLRSLSPLLGLGALLLIVPACPTQPICPPCSVNDVMADAGNPSAAPSSSAFIAPIDEVPASKVEEIEIVLKGDGGASETLKYSGGQISGLATGGVSIQDPDLYDVNGQIVVGAKVGYVTKSGTTYAEIKNIQPEGSTGTGTKPSRGPQLDEAPTAKPKPKPAPEPTATPEPIEDPKAAGGSRAELQPAQHPKLDDAAKRPTALEPAPAQPK